MSLNLMLTEKCYYQTISLIGRFIIEVRKVKRLENSANIIGDLHSELSNQLSLIRSTIDESNDGLYVVDCVDTAGKIRDLKNEVFRLHLLTEELDWHRDPGEVINELVALVSDSLSNYIE